MCVECASHPSSCVSCSIAVAAVASEAAQMESASNVESLLGKEAKLYVDIFLEILQVQASL